MQGSPSTIKQQGNGQVLNLSFKKFRIYNLGLNQCCNKAIRYISSDSPVTRQIHQWLSKK